MSLNEALTDAQVSNTLTASAIGAGTISADAAGRAMMAANYFNAATFLDKFAALSVDVSAGGGKITGALAVANGGTGSANAGDARTALGLAIGTNVQAYDATLASLAALGTVADRLAYTTALDTWAEATLTAAGRAILDDADAAAQRTTLGLAIGTDVQAYSAVLAAIVAGNIDAAAVGALLGTDSMTVANAADIIQDDAIIGAHIAPLAVDVSHLARIADTAVGAITSLGADIVLKLVQPDGVTADLDFTAPADLGNFEIIDAWVRPVDVNGANANTTQIQTWAAAAITDAMSTNGVASGGIVRATSVNDVNAEILSGGTIRIRRTKIGGNVAADVFVRVIKRA